jgi:hypothetical protein
MLKYLISVTLVSTSLILACGKPYQSETKTYKYGGSSYKSPTKKISIEDEYKKDVQKFEDAEKAINDIGYNILVTQTKKEKSSWSSYLYDEYSKEWQLHIPDTRDSNAVTLLTKFLESINTLLAYEKEFYFYLSNEQKEIFENLKRLKIDVLNEIDRLKSKSPFEEFKEKFCQKVEILSPLLKKTKFKNSDELNSECQDADSFSKIKKLYLRMTKVAHPDKHNQNNITGKISKEISEAIAPLLVLYQDYKKPN